jgi:hypothetical protein
MRTTGHEASFTPTVVQSFWRRLCIAKRAFPSVTGSLRKAVGLFAIHTHYAVVALLSSRESRKISAASRTT